MSRARPAACRRASAPPASPCGLKPERRARPRAARRPTRRTPTSAARFTRSGALAAPVLLCQRALRARRASARSSSTPATPTPPPAAAGFEDAAKMQGAAAMAGRRAEDQVAVASTGVIGVPLPTRARSSSGIARARARAARRRRRATSREAIRPPTRSPSARRARRRAAGGHRAPDRPGQGRGDDLARLRDDAVLRADRRGAVGRDVLTCCSACRVKRSFDRISVDGQLSTNDTVILQAQRRVRRRGRARDRGRAALRRGARRAAAPAGAVDRARRRGRPAGRPRGRPRRRRATPSTRVARAVADSPLVKTALYGGDPNWGRIAQAVGGGAARHRAAAGRHLRSRACRCARAAARCRYDEAALAEAVAGDEVEYESACPGEGAETELFFSDLWHEYVTINAEYTT